LAIAAKVAKSAVIDRKLFSNIRLLWLSLSTVEMVNFFDPIGRPFSKNVLVGKRRASKRIAQIDYSLLAIDPLGLASL
jgi:hypothetical protein